MTRSRWIVVGSLVVAGATACAPLNSAPRDAAAGAAGGTSSPLDAAVGVDAGGAGVAGMGVLAGTGGLSNAGGGGDGASAGGGPGGGGRGVASGGAPGTGGVAGSGGAAAGGRTGSAGAVGRGGSTGAGSGGSGAGGAPMCVAPGLTCAATTDCCQTGDTAPMGATCITNDNLCHAKCMDGTGCKSGCCATVTGQTYGACAATSFCNPLKGVGDPCAANGECETGLCSFWCRAACDSTNSLCSSTSTSIINSQGHVNWCVLLSAAVYSCFPGCFDNSDCTAYGTGFTCKAATDVDGTTDYVCSQ